MTARADWDAAIEGRASAHGDGRIPPARRQLLALGLAGLLLAGVAVAAAASFVWPSAPATDLTHDLGAIEQFPPGTVTTFFAPADGSSAPIANAVYLRFARTQPGGPSPGPWVTFHLVRLGSGEIVALSARDPHLGCTVPYRPSFEFDGREGWFRNPCHGETYDLAGYRAFGPAPRGLDRFPLTVRDGRVIVDLAHIERGPTALPPGYEPETGGTLGPLSTR
jgi:nitrite reductase/ring-hydroxylating ferredoxin subunit